MSLPSWGFLGKLTFVILFMYIFFFALFSIFDVIFIGF